MSDHLISLATAADRCGVSSRTLRRRLKDPQSGLRLVKIGRRRLLSSADLDVWIERQKERAALPGEVLAAFSADARELLEWAFSARRSAPDLHPPLPKSAPAKG